MNRFIGSLWSGFPYIRYIPEKSERKVYYSDVAEVEKAIVAKYGITTPEPSPPQQMKVPMSGKVKTKKQSFVEVDDDIE